MVVEKGTLLEIKEIKNESKEQNELIEGRGDGEKSKLKRVLDDDITGLALSGKLRN
jgi:hypothetical protein